MLDIIDYSISHHPSNKTRLLSPALFGAQGLGRILADSEDYGLTERALELGWRLRDGVGGKEKKEKWDQQLWMAMGEGEQEEAIRRRWKGVKKVTYLDVSIGRLPPRSGNADLSFSSIGRRRHPRPPRRSRCHAVRFSSLPFPRFC